MENLTPKCVRCCPSSTNDANVHGLLIVLLVRLFGLLNVVFLQGKKGKQGGNVPSEDK